MPTPTDILAWEDRYPWRYAGAKEQAIKAELDLTPTRYYQLLRLALDDPTAIAQYPSTAARMRRLMESRSVL